MPRSSLLLWLVPTLGGCSLLLDPSSLNAGCSAGEAVHDGKCVVPDAGRPSHDPSHDGCGPSSADSPDAMAAACSGDAHDAASAAGDASAAPSDAGSPFPCLRGCLDHDSAVDDGRGPKDDAGPQSSACPQSCANPDEQHCDVRCDPREGCVVVARDFDRDAHGDKWCQQAKQRGDDCDDHNMGTFVGAPERCDGLDNNCNGQTDLEEGLALSGENLELANPGSMPAIASPGVSFGVAFARAGDVWFQGLDLHGEAVAEAVLVDAAPAEDLAWPALAWGDDAFGLSYARRGHLGFRRLSESGESLGPEIDITPQGYQWPAYALVARVYADDWLSFVTLHGEAFVGRRISADGKVSSTYLMGTGNVFVPSVSVAGGQIGLAWTELRPGQASSIYAKPLSPELASLSAEDTPLMTSSTPGWAGAAVIATSLRGYGVAWVEQKALPSGEDMLDPAREVLLSFAEFDRDWKLRCSAVDLETTTRDSPLPFTPRDMVATEQGYLIVGTAGIAGGPLEMVEVHTSADACTKVQRFRVTDTPSAEGRLARSSVGNLLLVWQESAGEGATRVMRRTLTPTLCVP